MTPDYLMTLVSVWGYAIMIPIAIAEGPIITMIGAFLASMGLMNIHIVYAIGVFGDFAGDLVRYAIGRFGGTPLIAKYGPRFGITPERMRALKDTHFDAHLWRTVFFGKFTHAPNLLILVTAGAMRVPLWRFVLSTTTASALKVLVLVLIGYYLGETYTRVDAYLTSGWVFVIPISTVVLWYIWHSIKNRP